MKRFNFKLFENDQEHNGVPYGNITYVIAFAIPFIMFIALYAARDIFPFGTNTYLRSDMYHQYAPFFSEFWEKLRTGGSLTYTWDSGMGMNYTALYAYYLASPTNWLIALFPQKYIIEVMNAFIILKLAFASVTFTYYLTKRFKNKSCAIALFGTFYAMSGFVAAYSWNIMWLDCLVLLPLIILGLERLVKENKCFLYCISLGLCIFTNYYISIMVCMSVVIYYIVLMISLKNRQNYKIYLKKFFNFALYSLLAGGIAACLLLPEMYALSLSASSSTTFPKSLSQYFSIMEMMIRHLINVPIHMGLDHFPNIYCGVAIFLLIPLYIMNPKINTREKAGKVMILLIFLLSFNLNIPNYIWHGFHFPNSLPARPSFIYIFFLLIMSYEALKDIKEYSNSQVTGSFWFSILFLVLADQLFPDEPYGFKLIYFSAVFIILYMLLIYLYRNNVLRKTLLTFVLFSITIVECTINMEDTGLGITDRTYYMLDNSAVSSVMDYVDENDPGFYRIEKVTGVRSKNDSAWHNYPSISTFSSTSNAGISKLLRDLGSEGSTNAYAYQGGTLLTSAMFNIRYLLGNQIIRESNLIKYYYGNDGEFLYHNQYTLPVGFMVSSLINDNWKAEDSYDSIDMQNNFLQLNTGISDTFEQMYSWSSEMEVGFSPTADGHMYAVVKNQSLETVSVNVSGTFRSFSGLGSSLYTIDIGYVTTDDIITITGDSNLNITVYTMNETKFINAINKLNEGALNVTYYSDTKIEGDLNVQEDGIMWLSIPYDEGWKITVDGESADHVKINDALLGINLTEGHHDIRLSYRPVGLINGLILTFLSLLILTGLIIFRKNEMKGKLSLKALPVFAQNLLNTEDVIVKSDKKTIFMAIKESISEILKEDVPEPEKEDLPDSEADNVSKQEADDVSTQENNE